MSEVAVSQSPLGVPPLLVTETGQCLDHRATVHKKHEDCSAMLLAWLPSGCDLLVLHPHPSSHMVHIYSLSMSHLNPGAPVQLLPSFLPSVLCDPAHSKWLCPGGRCASCEDLHTPVNVTPFCCSIPGSAQDIGCSKVEKYGKGRPNEEKPE